MAKPIQIIGGVETVIRRREGSGLFWERVACCDCGLVHDIAYRVISDDELGIASWSNRRSTGQVRRHMRERDKHGQTGSH